MTTKAHKLLTGTDLHEPKGADSASADQVYAADGAGSGTWKKLTSANLAGSGNPFGSQLFHVRDEQTAGTNGQTFSGSTWNTGRLNTSKTNEISGASLASNQLTLPAGTYFLSGSVQLPSFGVLAWSKLRLRNTTDSNTTLVGQGNYFNNTANTATTGDLSISGRFTLAGTKVLELQIYTNVAGVLSPVNTGESEVYIDVLVWKL